MLNSLRKEFEKIDHLSDMTFLKTKILLPSIDFSYQKKFLTEVEWRILKMVAEKQLVQADDFKDIFKNKLPQEISRQIRRLRQLNLLIPEKPNARKYVLNIRSDLLRMGLLYVFDKEGFLP